MGKHIDLTTDPAANNWLKTAKVINGDIQGELGSTVTDVLSTSIVPVYSAAPSLVDSTTSPAKASNRVSENSAADVSDNFLDFTNNPEQDFRGDLGFRILDHNKLTKGSNKNYDWDLSSVLVIQNGIQFHLKPTDFALRLAPYHSKSWIGSHLGISRNAVIARLNGSGQNVARIGPVKTNPKVVKPKKPRLQTQQSTPLSQKSTQEPTAIFSSFAQTEVFSRSSSKDRVNQNILTRMGRAKGFLNADEVLALYSGIEVNRKSLLNALLSHPKALSIICGWYQDDLAHFCKHIWQSSEVTKPKEYAADIDDGTDSLDGNHVTDDHEVSSLNLPHQPAFESTWSQIGFDSEQLLAMFTKEGASFRREPNVPERSLQQVKSELVDAIIELPPKDSCLEDLVVTLRSGMHNLSHPEYEDAVRLGSEAMRGIKAAKEKMRQHNLHLVAHITQRFLNRGIDYNDLLQEGNIGLMQAVERFNYRLGYRFSTYAIWWIRQAVSKAIYNEAATIRIPIDAQKDYRTVTLARSALEKELGRMPTDSELAQKTSMPIKKIQKVLKFSFLKTASLDQPLRDDRDGVIGDFIVDEAVPDPFIATANNDLKKRMTIAFAELEATDPRLADVLRMRFGIDYDRSYTRPEIAIKYGVTSQGIDKILSRGLARLSKMAIRQGFHADIELSRHAAANRLRTKSWSSPKQSLQPE